MNTLRSLQDYGQSLWLDYIQRSLVAGGELKRLIEEDGVKGVTSNPSIFAKAITEGSEYRDALRERGRRGDSAQQIYEALAIEDVRGAADVLRPVYDATGRRDGYVSLEVSPHLAHDTEGTVAEARRLWASVNRPNLMIKVPGTPEGIPAVQALIAVGVNVNVTLLFSREAYRAAAHAYLAGLERRVADGADVAQVASVASFFVSRIDANVDAKLDRLAESAASGERARLAGLRGRAAIANARLAYRMFRELGDSPRWRALAQAGAAPQRLLWASTSTKSPAYRDVIYVEELIGPDTVNTLPPATLAAFRDQGRLRASLGEDPEGAAAVMAEIEAAGIAFDRVTDELLAEGVRSFAQAFEGLLAAIEQARPGGLYGMVPRTGRGERG
jgi:transaldolase/glucose-6-phosphate isomerase